MIRKLDFKIKNFLITIKDHEILNFASKSESGSNRKIQKEIDDLILRIQIGACEL